MVREERILLLRLCSVVLMLAEEVIDRDQYMKDFSSLDRLREAMEEF